MDDLGNALATDPEMRMLGGGNPAAIPAVQQIWRDRIQVLLTEDGGSGLDRALGTYDPPAGNPRFRQALASLLQREYAWKIESENVAITPGGQAAFFFLLNFLAGADRKILLPLVPEYIGYAPQGLDPSPIFTACAPLVELDPADPHRFKYAIDFDAVESRLAQGNIAAICVSRPTNPSGNVLTDAEIARLQSLARTHGIYLIIDGAYGTPFPEIIFTPPGTTTPTWDPETTIVTLSLSKLGLPGTRTGIVLAAPEIAAAITAATANVGLANTSIGQAIVTPLIESGEILTIARDTVRPYYADRSRSAQTALSAAFAPFPDTPWRAHQSEGALFLWLWFPGLPITAAELYQRLKKRKVLVVPGHHFFFGLETPLDAQHECVRITYSQSETIVQEALAIIAEEVAHAFELSST